MKCQTTKFLSDFKILKKQSLEAYDAIDKHEQVLQEASKSLLDLLAEIQKQARHIINIIDRPYIYNSHSVLDYAEKIDDMIDECKKVLPLEYWDE